MPARELRMLSAEPSLKLTIVEGEAMGETRDGASRMLVAPLVVVGLAQQQRRMMQMMMMMMMTLTMRSLNAAPPHGTIETKAIVIENENVKGTGVGTKKEALDAEATS